MTTSTRSTPAQFPLRLPKDLHHDIQELADEQGISMNQFLVYVITSRVAEMKQSREFLHKKTAGKSRAEAAASLTRILGKVSVEAPIAPDDEVRTRTDARAKASKRSRTVTGA